MSFYDEIEEGVRKYVRLLRDEGINTTCSCHHEGYIQAESHDPTSERRIIWNVMFESGVKDWTATIYVSSLGTADSWEIRSNSFKLEDGKR